MQNNPIGWFEIYVQDMDRARTFYETVLAVTLARLPSGIEMWGFPMKPNQPGASGALVRYEGRASGGNSTVVYFTCEDCAVEENRAVVNGGRIQRAKSPIGQYGFVSLVIDTEGNLLGLHSMK